MRGIRRGGFSGEGLRCRGTGREVRDPSECHRGVRLGWSVEGGRGRQMRGASGERQAHVNTVSAARKCRSPFVIASDPRILSLAGHLLGGRLSVCLVHNYPVDLWEFASRPAACEGDVERDESA